MKVKKFIAPSMPEAMKKIRAELGEEAVILNSKIVFSGGFLGFFRKKSIEVIAAMDQVRKVEPIVKEKQISASIPQKLEEVQIPKASQDVLHELEDLKGLIRNLSMPTQELVSYPEPILHVQNILIEQGLNEKTRGYILGILLEKWYVAGGNASIEEVIRWCHETMVDAIKDYQFGEITFQKKYINVVGPTGVGKTTTLAKIAADCKLTFNKKVALITTDTYRIAAIEQLKTYAKILSIPLEVCYNMDDFKAACENYSDYDVVLIDTAGRNFRNAQYVEELKEIIEYGNNMETLLVLSLTAKQSDMEAIYKQFSSIDIKQFIFTKADETASYGAMFNMIERFKIGVAYVTNGQNVPDDRISASPEIITNLILEDVKS